MLETASAIERSRERRTFNAPARKTYSFARAGSLWMALGRGIERADAAPLGLSRGLGLATGQSRAVSSPASMLDANLLKCWLIADRGLSLGSTTKQAGTSPPTPVTISGNLAQSIGLVLKIATTGARGTATFDVYIDGGTTAYITGLTTGANVALTDGGSKDLGISAQFTAGTYGNTDISYTATLASWTDLFGGNIFSAPGGVTASPRPIAGGLNNRPIITSDGSNNTRLSCTGGLAALFNGDDTPITVFMVMKSNTATPGGSNPWLNLGSSTGAATARFEFGVTNSGNSYRSTKTDDVASSAIPTGGTLDTAWHYSSWNQAGTTMVLRVDGSAVTLSGAGAQNVSTCTFNEALLFARNTGGTPSNAINGGIAEVLIYAGTLGATSVTEKELYLKSQWRL